MVRTMMDVLMALVLVSAGDNDRHRGVHRRVGALHIAVALDELWRGGGEIDVTLRRDERQIGHRDGVHQVAVDEQPDFHCVGRHADEVRKCTDDRCRRGVPLEIECGRVGDDGGWVSAAACDGWCDAGSQTVGARCGGWRICVELVEVACVW